MPRVPSAQLDSAVTNLARRQFGIAARSQLADLGLSPKMIRTRRQSGFLTDLYPGAFLVGGSPIRWETRLLAAQFSLGTRAVVSHRSAAALRGLEGYEPGPLDLTVLGSGRGGLPGVRIYRSTACSIADFSSKGPFRLSKPERLLVELAGVVSPRMLEVALDSVLYKGLTTFPRIAAYLDDTARSGVRGVAPLRHLLAQRDSAQAPAESIFETDFYRLLKSSRWSDASFQYEVFDEDGFVGRLDVAYPDRKVGVEAQSKRWHSPAERVQRDSDRHNRLLAAGWRILYETYENLRNRPGEILLRLEKLLLAST